MTVSSCTDNRLDRGDSEVTHQLEAPLVDNKSPDDKERGHGNNDEIFQIDRPADISVQAELIRLMNSSRWDELSESAQQQLQLCNKTESWSAAWNLMVKLDKRIPTRDVVSPKTPELTPVTTAGVNETQQTGDLVSKKSTASEGTSGQNLASKSGVMNPDKRIGGYQVVERYSVCRCLYYKHAIDPTEFFGEPGAVVVEKTVLVGYACSVHSSEVHELQG